MKPLLLVQINYRKVRKFIETTGSPMLSDFSARAFLEDGNESEDHFETFAT